MGDHFTTPMHVTRPREVTNWVRTPTSKPAAALDCTCGDTCRQLFLRLRTVFTVAPIVLGPDEFATC